MREDEINMTVSLLSESFSESMLIAGGYVKFLEFLVKNYLIEKRERMPHNPMLIGEEDFEDFEHVQNGEEDFQLAGTVELAFDRMGANAKPPTPSPPQNSPYICNMAVRKAIRLEGELFD